MKPLPIKERIRNALGVGPMRYFDLMHVVFPTEQFPNAFKRARRGGPAGGQMAFSRALRELGARTVGRHTCETVVWLPAKHGCGGGR